MPDKLNHVDYRWYVMRTKRHQESKLVELLEKHKSQARNILEIYAPTHTTVNVRHDSDERQKPLFAGIVFVLATQDALMNFMKEYSLNGGMQYERREENGGSARVRVIPEGQMRAFRDYNENYADKVIVLERPYTDYAFSRALNRAVISRCPIPMRGTCMQSVCIIPRETGCPSAPRKGVPSIYWSASCKPAATESKPCRCFTPSSTVWSPSRRWFLSARAFTVRATPL